MDKTREQDDLMEQCSMQPVNDHFHRISIDKPLAGTYEVESGSD